VTHYRVIETGIRCRLGEGPYWSTREQALYWVDILGQSVHRLRHDDGSMATWHMPEQTAWLMERARASGFVAGVGKNIVFLNLEPLTLTPFACLEPNVPRNRLNDAKADAQGHLWAGTMPLNAQGDSGSLYRISPDGRVNIQDRGYGITNGPAFSPDGRYLYHNDSLRGLVYRFDLHDTGELSHREIFLRFSPGEGLPDGMTVDAEGALWIAVWGGSRVSRYTADGRLDRSVPLPASQITSCTFGGASLDRLFVTSAAEGADAEALAGALFEIDPRVCGFAPNLFSA
jgi:xylono-1,5-lactonase